MKEIYYVTWYRKDDVSLSIGPVSEDEAQRCYNHLKSNKEIADIFKSQQYLQLKSYYNSRDIEKHEMSIEDFKKEFGAEF